LFEPVSLDLAESFPIAQSSGCRIALVAHQLCSRPDLATE
jgi:hypothetical protein